MRESKVVALQKGLQDGRKTRHTRTVRPAERRLAWSGLTDEELKRPGAALLAMLVQAANDRGHQMRELADNLGVTYGYIAQLRGGIRDVRHISDEFADRCAQYLGIPRMAVLVAAGKVKLADIYSAPSVLEHDLERALKFIQRDAHYGPYMPPEIFQQSPAVKQFIVMMFEDASGYKLLAGKVPLKEIADKMGQVFEQINATE